MMIFVIISRISSKETAQNYYKTHKSCTQDDENDIEKKRSKINQTNSGKNHQSLLVQKKSTPFH